MKGQSRGDLSAANPCLLRIGSGMDALAQLLVGKARPEVLSPPLLNFQCLSPFRLCREKEQRH